MPLAQSDRPHPQQHPLTPTPALPQNKTKPNPQDFKERHTDTSVYFVITLAEKEAPELLVDDAALMKRCGHGAVFYVCIILYV